MESFRTPYWSGEVIASKGESSWVLRRWNTNDFCNFYLGSIAMSATGTVNVNDGKWHHIVGSHDASSTKLYIDGVLDGTGNGGAIAFSNYPVRIGTGSKMTTRYFDGIIDEVRICDVTRSSNWIWACWLNQASNSVFNSYGEIESGLPIVGNNSASNIAKISVDLTGTLFSTGAAPTEVCVFWGTSDGGTDRDAWAHTNSFDTVGEGNLSTNVTGLSHGTQYYYRFYATNSYGEAWSEPTANFETHIDLNPFRHRMQITFSGYDRSETLTDFPTLVVLNTGIVNFVYNQFLTSNGGDLRFVTETNSLYALRHEIEQWNTSGDSLVWVQLASLAASTDSIWAYWGLETTAPLYTTDGSTWSNSYAGVWHLGESPSNGGTFDDSASTNTGYFVDANGNSDSEAIGQIGGAVDFNGDADYVVITNENNFDLGDSITVSAWVNGWPNNVWRPWVAKRGEPVSSGEGWQLRRFESTLGWTTRGVPISGPEGDFTGTTSFVSGEWHHIVGVLGDGRREIYVDGELDAGEDRSGTITDTDDPLVIGGRIYTNAAESFFDGLIDEVRVSSVPRSSNWLWACYMSQASNSVFNTYSANENTTPIISNDSGASSITASSASFNGYLSSTGTAATTVYLFWGTNDGGTVKADWGHTNVIGGRDVGQITTNITGLAANTTYCYRFYATNDFGGCFAESTESFSTLIDVDDFAMNMTITLSGYNKSEPLTNFPVLVILGTHITDFNYAAFTSPDGGDLRFYDAALTNELRFEVDEWNPGGNSYVWVKLPKISDAGISFKAYWGDSGLSMPAYATNGEVWTEGYVGVWHMGDTNANGDLPDSGAGGNTGTNYGTVNIAGFVGNARDFEYNDGNYVVVANESNFDFSPSISISAWIKVESFHPGAWQDGVIVSKGDNTWILRRWSSQNYLNFWLGGAHETKGDDNANDGQWHYVAGVHDSSLTRLYVDGVQDGSDGNGGDITAGDYIVKIGVCPQNTYRYFDGIIDEVRISNVARSSNWVWACHMNQASNSSFLTYEVLRGSLFLFR